MKCVYNEHNFTVVGRGGWGTLIFVFFPRFQHFSYKNGVQIIIVLKLNVRHVYSVTMLKNASFFTKKRFSEIFLILF